MKRALNSWHLLRPEYTISGAVFVQKKKSKKKRNTHKQTLTKKSFRCSFQNIIQVSINKKEGKPASCKTYWLCFGQNKWCMLLTVFLEKLSNLWAWRGLTLRHTVTYDAALGCGTVQLLHKPQQGMKSPGLTVKHKYLSGSFHSAHSL